MDRVAGAVGQLVGETCRVLLLLLAGSPSRHLTASQHNSIGVATTKTSCAARVGRAGCQAAALPCCSGPRPVDEESLGCATHSRAAGHILQAGRHRETKSGHAS